MNKVLKIILVITLTSVLVSVFATTGCSSCSATEIKIGNPAPDFELQNTEGQTISLSGLRGKPVLLNFWKTSCYPCRLEMPFLQAIYNEWSDRGLELLTINIGESLSTIEKFMRDYFLSLPVLLDTGVNITQKYVIQYIPATFLIDENGIIKAMKVGAFRDKAEIEQALMQLFPDQTSP